MTKKILSIETSWDVGGITFHRGTECVFKHSFEEEKNHGTELAPAVRHGLNFLEWDSEELECICFDIGPGSYTGLRVGLTFAKTMAFTREIPLVPIEAPRAIVRKIPRKPGTLLVIINAYIDELYAQRFRYRGGFWERSSKLQTIKADQREEFQDVDYVTGNGILAAKEELEDSSVELLDQSYWNPDAEILGRLGRNEENEHTVSGEDLFPLEPIYLRPARP